MGLMIISFIAATILIAISFVGCKDSAGDTPAQKSSGTGQTSDSIVLKNATKADMLKQLKKLANTDPPKTLQLGAMCYEMAAPPDRAEYVCPTCNEKTLHVTPRDGIGEIAEFLSWQLDNCRRQVKKIKGLNVALDESSFCKKCQPGDVKHELALIITYEESKAPHRVAPISDNDLQLLIEFTRGKVIHDDGPGGEEPLKKSMKRLEVLLGVKLEETK
jgi:hypothetical protein